VRSPVTRVEPDTCKFARRLDDTPIPTLFQTLKIVPPVKLSPVESARGTWFGKKPNQVAQALHVQLEPILLAPVIHMRHSCPPFSERVRKGLAELVLQLASIVT